MSCSALSLHSLLFAHPFKVAIFPERGSASSASSFSVLNLPNLDLSIQLIRHEQSSPVRMVV